MANYQLITISGVDYRMPYTYAKRKDGTWFIVCPSNSACGICSLGQVSAEDRACIVDYTTKSEAQSASNEASVTGIRFIKGNTTWYVIFKETRGYLSATSCMSGYTFIGDREKATHFDTYKEAEIYTRNMEIPQYNIERVEKKNG